MAELKTQPTSASVPDFIAAIDNAQRRADSETLITLMQEATGADPILWGPSIVGFGTHRYKYETGREGDWFELGFSPRKTNFSLHLMGGLSRHTEILARLGKHKTSVACLYINRLSDIDLTVLKELLQESVVALRSG
jgi:hypothetical protein